MKISKIVPKTTGLLGGSWANEWERVDTSILTFVVKGFSWT